jgi:energy-coupling factor transporter ATP-binding protein EcfA2
VVTKPTYKVSIDSVPVLNRPFRAEFGRINVLLGSNGTGKSKILDAIKGNPGIFGTRTDVAYVEGGRTFTIPQSLALSKQTIGYAQLDTVQQSHKNKRSQKLTDRITEALFALERQGDAEYRNHSNAVEQWAREGQKGTAPRRSEPPLDQLCAVFSSVFPEITLKIDGSKNIHFSKNGSAPYQPAALSDGEKQVFCLVADLLLLSRGNPLIVVDEPELNLHPSLAIDLWTLIESTLPDAMFVYATHSVAFAMKSGVDTLTILPRTGVEAFQVQSISDVDPVELRCFLGAIPSIMATSRAIVVEGDKSSLDTSLYRWIVGDSSVTVEGVGSCNNVVSAVKRDGVWKTVGTPQRLIGIIDRDFKSEEMLKSVEPHGVMVLPYHEIESLLTIPSLIRLLAERLGIAKAVPSNDEIQTRVLARWTEENVGVAVRRTFETLRLDFCPSLTRSQMSQDVELVTKAIHQSGDVQLRELGNRWSLATVRAAVDLNLGICQKALRDRDFEEIRKLMPGKVMLGDILGWTGCAGPDQVVRGLAKHVKVDEITELQALKKSLRDKLGISN